LTCILFISSGKDRQGQMASIVLPSDASYKLRRKLHQTGNSVEVAQNEHRIENNISAKSGTEPEPKSNDDSWVGDGAGLEFAIHALDGKGSAVGDEKHESKNKVSNRNAARKRRRDWRKKEAREAEAARLLSIKEVELVKNEVIMRNDQDPLDIAFEDEMEETQSDGCIVIDPMPDETMAFPPMKKMKANMLYNMRRRCRQKLTKHTNRTVETTETANFERSSIVHVLRPDEIDTLIKDKGLQVIHLSQPTRTTVEDVDTMNWMIDSASMAKLSTINFSTSNIAIISTFENIKHDKRLAFIGNFQGPTPKDSDYILLGLFLTTITDPNEKDVNVQDFLKICDSTKYNINIGRSSGHHDSQGANFGIGARREFRIKDNLSSVGSYASKTNKDPENIFLEKRIIDEMEKATAAVGDFMGYSLHDLNAVQLKAICERAKIAGFENDLYMLGETGYATLFYNFDASTLEKHVEFDMNMTTIFVPKQEWKGKDINHLQFNFHLTGKDNGILSIPIFPGRILYYHGFLLTHHQMHDGGNCSENGCCLNYSAYANRKLLAYFIKSFQRFLDKMENSEG